MECDQHGVVRGKPIASSLDDVNRLQDLQAECSHNGHTSVPRLGFHSNDRQRARPLKDCLCCDRSLPHCWAAMA